MPAHETDSKGQRASAGCPHCDDRSRARLGFRFTMAFQPIVDVEAGQIMAHEALVRGVNGEGAGTVLAQVQDDTRYAFDQACRTQAVKLIAGLDAAQTVSINFMPNAVYDPQTCIQATLAAAARHGFPVEQIIFEVTEGEQVTDIPHLQRIFAEYRRQGFRTAIDDFGAGYSGLSLLAELQPDIVKLDMNLIRGIDADHRRRAIVRGSIVTCRELGIDIVAEGVETSGEFHALRALGIRYLQGFLLARPAFESLHPMSAIPLPA